jgi:hypothetical protein
MQNEIEIMRVLRTPPMGSLLVIADGRRLKLLASVKDDTVRRRILAAIGELIDFAGGYDALVREGVAPPLPTAAATSSAPAEEPGEELTSEQDAFLNRLERELRQSTLPETGSLTAEPTVLPVDTNDLTTPGVNLVADIDQILQRHVAESEALAHRSIHLRQTPGELLQIVVDGRVYEHPNDIEDARVRDVLKRALKEWEAR